MNCPLGATREDAVTGTPHLAVSHATAPAMTSGKTCTGLN
jgi:hypothetical protein